MQIKSFTVGPFHENTYIAYNENHKKALIVDPGEPEIEIINFIKSNKLEIIIILLTHAHIDHIGGIKMIKDHFSVPIYMHKSDLNLYQKAEEQANFFKLKKIEKLPSITNFVKNKQEISFVSNIFFKVIETPGHTKGSVCYYEKNNNILFTGDTLFKNSIGQTNFPGASDNPLEIIDSINNELYSLPDEVIIYPGHMNKSTIGKEKIYNPFTLKQSNKSLNNH